MNLNSLIVALLLCVGMIHAQENYLIRETKAIKIFETKVSNTSTGNIFPVVYKNGLLYLSNDGTENYKLYYSDLQNESIKIRTNSRFNIGPVAVAGNKIYFSAFDKNRNLERDQNSAIHAANFINLKIEGQEKFLICDINFSYEHPTISEDGKQMVLVSNEKGSLHLLEFVKNEKNEWIKKGLVFISQPYFDILNPTIYDENTIYFSTDINEGKVKEVIYRQAGDEIRLSEIKRVKGPFNIYKITRSKGRWGLPEKMPHFNSDFDDLGVLFTSEKTGYLNTYRFNSTDNIYYFELK